MLTHAANCPVGGNFGCTCGAEEEAARKTLEAVAVYTRLGEMSAQELVNAALNHMPEMSLAYELLVEQLCTRVYPNWSNEDPPTEHAKAGVE